MLFLALHLHTSIKIDVCLVIKTNVNMDFIGMEKNVCYIQILALLELHGQIFIVNPMEHAKTDFILIHKDNANLSLNSAFLLQHGMEKNAIFQVINVLKEPILKMDDVNHILHVLMA
eukprot:TRINITY_DN40711_c0_g1_i1.p1 TRINITY_DN40711_c0_g1~~TRINITY_DN40711_c0_g1_i1.p1  ORF type:complete len:117 (-),score=8.12 TRINITY_DN40711_c0_g1_i1:86-436(-)